MITIDKSTKEEIKEFGVKEWIAPDIKYYGSHIPWIEKNFVFKAEEDGKIVGSIYGKFAAGVLYIDDLIVAEDKRGSGIGKMLMKQAEEFGLSMKAHKSYLITWKGWSIGSFYENLGYKKAGEFLNHFRHADFVIYEKFFSAN